MKRAKILFCILVLGTTMLYAQTGPKFSYDKSIIDLGTIFSEELELVTLDIDFSNTGDQPLVVSQVRGCCGTRITNWTKEPIDPEQKGKIGIEFRVSPTSQNISRTITATCNDPEKPTQMIRVVAKVAQGSSQSEPTEKAEKTE